MSLQFLTPQVAHLEGKLYSGNLSETQSAIESAFDKTPSLLLNLNSVERLDSAGAFMLFIASRKALENKKELIFLCTENDIVKTIFLLLGISFITQIPEII